MSEKRRRQTGAALAISAGLHLLLALLVLRGVIVSRPPARRVERPPTAIELSVVETTHQDRSDLGRSGVSPPPPRRRAPGHRSIESGEATPPATPSQTPPAPPTAPPSELPSKLPSKPIDLSFEALREGAKQRATATPGVDEALERLLAPPPERPAGPARRRPIAELRAEADRRAAAVANLRTGRADPLLFDLLRHARDCLIPGATHIA